MLLKMSIAPKITGIGINGDHYPNIYHKFSYNFPHYYKIYFNVTYCLLITPFRISFKGNSAKIVTNPIQMVLCAVVNGLVCVLAILCVRRDVYAKIKDKPDVLFTIASNSCWMWYIIIYAMVFWSKRINTLLAIPYKPSNYKVTAKGVLLIVYGASMTALYYVVFVIFDENFVVQPILDNFSSTMVYITSQNRNRSQPVVVFNEISVSHQAFVLTAFIVDFFYNTIISFLELFGLLSTIAVHEITSNLYPLFLKHKSGELMVLLQHYADMKNVFGKINEVNGPILLIIFVQIIPWISSSVIEIIDEEKWPKRAYMIIYYSLYLGLFGFAAEANHKAKIYKKRIHVLQKMEMDKTDFYIRNRSAYLASYMKGTEGATALAGWKFFFITYSFIGASVSVLVTFSMIMVQFKTSISTLS